MNCLDTSVLIEYLNGTDVVGNYVEANERRPLFAPTIALHETFIGAARAKGATGLGTTRQALSWVEPIELTADAAAEAALIEMELHEAGTPIGALDTLIAGVARSTNATLVTRDTDFERVRELDIELLTSDE